MTRLSFRSLRRRFQRDQRGSVMAESMILMTLLAWVYVAFYVYWDAFRTVNTSQKASYTIADMISREMATINPAYINGMRDVFAYMVPGTAGERIRVTSIRWVQTNNRFEVHWSASSNTTSMPIYTTTSLQAVRGGIPAMSDGDHVVLVETEIDYAPLFNVGVAARTMKQFIVTRPRFSPRICMTGTCS